MLTFIVVAVYKRNITARHKDLRN